MDYLVSWEIDVFDAATPIEAALQARKAQTRPDTIATVLRCCRKMGALPSRWTLPNWRRRENRHDSVFSRSGILQAAVLNRIKQSPRSHRPAFRTANGPPFLYGDPGCAVRSA